MNRILHELDLEEFCREDYRPSSSVPIGEPHGWVLCSRDCLDCHATVVMRLLRSRISHLRHLRVIQGHRKVSPT